MHGLTVHNIHVDQVLSPVATTLDHCWWYLGGAGMSFASIRPPAQLPPPQGEAKSSRRGPGRHSRGRPVRFEPADRERYLKEMRTAQEECSTWVERLGSARVGKPGFFSRYAAGMDHGWVMYFASDAPTLEETGLADAVSRFARVWFAAPPADLASDICLITRDVDSAYLDLFFRDEWMYRSVLDHAAIKGTKASPFRNRIS